MTENAAIGRSLTRTAIAVAAAFALLIVGLWAGVPSAQAATPPGVATTVLHDGAPLQEGAELHGGDSLTLRVQYTSAAVGQVVDIELGAGVTVSDTFPANSAVESIEKTATGVRLTFKDPWPDISQGILDLALTVDAVDTSAPGAVSWNDGDEHTIPVVFVKDGDVKENVGDGFAKAVAPGNLDGYVLKDGDGNYTGLDPDITGRDLTYTLTVNTPAGAIRPDGFTVSDLLPDGFAYVAPLAITATETTWDANGYNAEQGSRTFAVDSSTSDGFDGHVVGDLVGPSVLKLTYTVRVDDVNALDAALQTAFDARNGAPGNYEINPRNTATFGADATASATIRLRGTVAGPCPSCGAFAKTGDLGTVNELTRDDGTLLEPVDIGYTLRANLAQWDGHSPNYTLGTNVVIRDDLLSQAEWMTGAGFVTVTGTGPVTTLTEAASCPATASAFAADEYVGQYCVDGQRLLINVGNDPSTNITIAARAQLNTVAGLPTEGSVDNGERYRVRNTATYTWGSSSYGTPNVDGYVVVPNASGEAVDDASAFAKAAPERLSAVPDQPLQVPFTFTVNTARTGVSAADSTIVDHVDTRYFDLAGDLSNVTVAGRYAAGGTTTALTASDFALTRSGNDLQIVLSAAGAMKASAAGGVLTVDLTLTTFPFDGKQTIDITNSATLFGAGPDPLYVSEVETQGSSFGAESETRKHVFDRVTNGGEWSQVVIPDGANPIYVYRLQFIGHPGFGGIAIDPERDVLPAGLEFVGFVDEAEKATGANAFPGPVNTLQGNLVAVFDPSAGPRGTITLSQRPGTTFPDGATANVYFAARIVDENAAIVNEFGNSSTTLLPGGPSVDIEKWTEDGGAPAYDQYGALLNDGYSGDFDTAPGKRLTVGEAQVIRFTVSNDGPEALRDIAVTDVLDSGAGKISGLVCTFPDDTVGTEWAGPLQPGERFECEGTLPALSAGKKHADTARVSAVGVLSGLPVDDADEWHGETAPEGLLATTGGALVAPGVVFAAVLLLVAGLLLFRLRRRGA